MSRKKEGLATTGAQYQLDELRKAVADFEQAKLRLRAAIVHYELTDDHDHGRGPLRPGAICPGGDCIVHEARALAEK